MDKLNHWLVDVVSFLDEPKQTVLPHGTWRFRSFWSSKNGQRNTLKHVTIILVSTSWGTLWNYPLVSGTVTSTMIILRRQELSSALSLRQQPAIKNTLQTIRTSETQHKSEASEPTGTIEVVPSKVSTWVLCWYRTRGPPDTASDMSVIEDLFAAIYSDRLGLARENTRLLSRKMSPFDTVTL